MKKLIILSFILLSTTLFAQDVFSGSVTMEIEVKGDGADQFAAFMPTSYDYHFSGGDMRMKINGGMMAAMMGEILVKGDEEVAYILKASEQKAYKLITEEDSTETDQEMPRFEKTTETKKIAGYTCTKYKVFVKDEKGVEQEQTAWITEELKIKMPDTDGADGGGIFIAGINGAVMQMESTMDMGGQKIEMTITTTKVSTTEPDASLFLVPEGWTVVETTPEGMFGGMGNK